MKNFFYKAKTLYRFWKTFENEKAAFLSGGMVKEFEDALAGFLEMKYAVAVASGTDALVLSLKAFGVGPGDEVIVPATSAFATAAAVRWVHATPVFVDVKSEDMLIDLAMVERAITRNTKAIIPVHLNGKIADMEAVRSLAKKHSLAVIEDAAQAIGSRYKNKSAGYFGDVACYSFNPHKILSAHDGGAVVTNNPDIAEKISLMRTYGARPGKIHLDHPMVGVSSRLSPYHAAILVEAIPFLPAVIRRSRENFFMYSTALSGIDNIAIPSLSSEEHFINGHRFFVLSKSKNALFPALKRRNPEIRTDHVVPLPYFTALNQKGCQKGDFPVAERIAREAVFLPTHSALSKDGVEAIADLIASFSGGGCE